MIASNDVSRVKYENAEASDRNSSYLDIGNRHVDQFLFRQTFENIQKYDVSIENMIELSSLNTIRNCVESNIGISSLPRFTVEKELQ